MSLALIWRRLKHSDDEFPHYRAGAYRIDPEVAWNARSYAPKPRQWRVYFDPEGTRYGGKEVGLEYSVRAAKQKAQTHHAAQES